jgi:catechol-2,3-dioxygenase
MIITSVNHIHFQFPAHSKEAIRFFYATVLGPMSWSPPTPSNCCSSRWASSACASRRRLGATGRKPSQHVAFNVQGISDLKQRLHAFDLAFIESHPDQPAQQIYVKDPAGNQLEFLNRPLKTHCSPWSPHHEFPATALHP